MKSSGRKRAPVGQSGAAGKRSSARLRSKSSVKKPDSEGHASDDDSPTKKLVCSNSNDKVRATISKEANGSNGEKDIGEKYTVSDEDLFSDEMHQKECQVCNVRMEWNSNDANFQLCCGKEICSGCLYSQVRSGVDSYLKDASWERAYKHTDCPFCGETCFDTDEEAIERLHKLLEENPNNGHAWHFLAFQYANGNFGLPRDMVKANELWTKAGAELGFVDALNSLANSYNLPRGGFEKDDRKAKYYYSLAAMKGHMQARYNVGYYEEENGNMEQAVKHYIISAKGGFDHAKWKLHQLKRMGHLSQEQLDDALNGHKKYKDEVMTGDRVIAHWRL